ncbi:uncharacterized protein B0T23DRAFT_397948 [Neurospora hispaniola]|uniref:Uncharacterized protein n=1 Tax=Neurospora hispaniola TaxID=588809 RepID=A0AAJ0MPL6_9PEZI|nr:hypothetical protein B0T23DRAFT_397948 [Neurospora hispaniola]
MALAALALARRGSTLFLRAPLNLQFPCVEGHMQPLNNLVEIEIASSIGIRATHLRALISPLSLHRFFLSDKHSRAPRSSFHLRCETTAGRAVPTMTTATMTSTPSIASQARHHNPSILARQPGEADPRSDVSMFAKKIVKRHHNPSQRTRAVRSTRFWTHVSHPARRRRNLNDAEYPTMKLLRVPAPYQTRAPGEVDKDSNSRRNTLSDWLMIEVSEMKVFILAAVIKSCQHWTDKRNGPSCPNVLNPQHAVIGLAVNDLAKFVSLTLIY